MIQDEMDMSGRGIYLGDDGRDASNRSSTALGSRAVDDAPDRREAADGTENGHPDPPGRDGQKAPEALDHRSLRAADRRMVQDDTRPHGHPSLESALRLRLHGRLRDGQAGHGGVPQEARRGVLRACVSERRGSPSGLDCLEDRNDPGLRVRLCSGLVALCRGPLLSSSEPGVFPGRPYPGLP